MTSEENDVAVLVRLKAARERATAAKQSRVASGSLNQLTSDQRQEAARSRWTASIALLRKMAASYQARSDDLGISLHVEELIRLKASLPEVVVHFTRVDEDSGTRILFRMTREGRTFCRIQQTRGRRQSNLNHDDCLIEMSERNLRRLFRTIVQIIIVK